MPQKLIQTICAYTSFKIKGESPFFLLQFFQTVGIGFPSKKRCPWDYTP